MCHLSRAIFFYFFFIIYIFFYKVVVLVCGGSVINGAYPFQFALVNVSGFTPICKSCRGVCLSAVTDLKSGSTLRLGWPAVLLRYLSREARRFSTNSGGDVGVNGPGGGGGGGGGQT